jgi:hypothetical protein
MNPTPLPGCHSHRCRWIDLAGLPAHPHLGRFSPAQCGDRFGRFSPSRVVDWKTRVVEFCMRGKAFFEYTHTPVGPLGNGGGFSICICKHVYVYVPPPPPPLPLYTPFYIHPSLLAFITVRNEERVCRPVLIVPFAYCSFTEGRNRTGVRAVGNANTKDSKKPTTKGALATQTRSHTRRMPTRRQMKPRRSTHGPHVTPFPAPNNHHNRNGVIPETTTNRPPQNTAKH